MTGSRMRDFLSNTAWDRITRFMAEKGKKVPKRNLTTLRYEIIASPASTDEMELAF